LIAAHHQPVAAHLPAFQPVEEAHAEQAHPELTGLRDQRRHCAFDDIADCQAIERDGGGAGAAVGGVDVDRVGQEFKRQSRGLRRLLGEHDGGRAGVEHHGDARAVDLGRHLEVAAAAAHDLYASLAAHRSAARDQFREHAIADAAELGAIGIGKDQDKNDGGPEQRRLDRLRNSLAEQHQH
jgi:hypothetical protein